MFAALRGFGQQLVRAGLQLLLVVALVFGLSACGGTPSGLTGTYVDDTVSVAKSLLSIIAPEDGQASSEQQQQARDLINEYISLYRPNSRVNGLASFTTMQTALNSLAAHYASYNNRPLSDDLRARLEKEHMDLNNKFLQTLAPTVHWDASANVRTYCVRCAVRLKSPQC